MRPECREEVGHKLSRQRHQEGKRLWQVGVPRSRRVLDWRTCGLEGVLIVVAVIKIIIIATHILLLVYINKSEQWGPYAFLV